MAILNPAQSLEIFCSVRRLFNSMIYLPLQIEKKIITKGQNNFFYFYVRFSVFLSFYYLFLFWTQYFSCEVIFPVRVCAGPAFRRSPFCTRAGTHSGLSLLATVSNCGGVGSARTVLISNMEIRAPLAKQLFSRVSPLARPPAGHHLRSLLHNSSQKNIKAAKLLSRQLQVPSPRRERNAPREFFFSIYP